jgi:mannose-6-phosphate isomerase-like protein (cupin superfamily)
MSAPRVLRGAAFAPMPDGTQYVELLARSQPELSASEPVAREPFATERKLAANEPAAGTATASAPSPFGAGVVKVPPAVTSWGHNHCETEAFVVLSGQATLEWDGGREALEAGDLVVVPPFTHHAFVNTCADRETTLLCCHWTDRDTYVDAAARHADALVDAGGDTSVLVLTDRAVNADGASRIKADIFLRALRQQRVDSMAVACGRSLSAHPLDPYQQQVVRRLQAIGMLDVGGEPGGDRRAVIRLERHRALLLRAIDRVAMTACVKRYVAETFAHRLPTITVPESELESLIAPAAQILRTQRAIWFFPIAAALVPAIVTPMVVEAMASDVPDRQLPLPTLHGSTVDETLPDPPIGAARRHTWRRWLERVFDRAQRHANATVPEPGRWSTRHLSAFAELASIGKSAARAFEPRNFSVDEIVAVLDRVVDCAQQLEAAEPWVLGTETFEAESRTTLAIELAAVRQLGVFTAPVWPAFGAAVEQALGITICGVRWSNARELVPARTPVRWQPLGCLLTE